MCLLSCQRRVREEQPRERDGLHWRSHWPVINDSPFVARHSSAATSRAAALA